jgi:GT2 family glycosyltransferase
MITASVVLYNTNHEDLKKLVECTSSSLIDVLYVIDNSATDEIAVFVKSLSPKVVYIFNNCNLGYGEAHNIGLQKAIDTGADYHVILNPDIYFAGDAIEQLLDYMNANSGVGVAMPMIKYPNGDIQFLCKLQPTPFDLIVRRFFPACIAKKNNIRYELKHSGYNKPMDIPCLSGCFMFLRVSILNETGLFDRRFFMYCEDFDFYRRIHARYKTMFYPYATVIHAHQKGSYTNKKLLLNHIKSAIRYFNKWGWFFDKSRRNANRRILSEIKNHS